MSVCTAVSSLSAPMEPILSVPRKGADTFKPYMYLSSLNQNTITVPIENGGEIVFDFVRQQMVAKTQGGTLTLSDEDFVGDPTNNFGASVDRTVHDFAMTLFAKKKQMHFANHVPRAFRYRLPFRVVTPEFLEFPDSSNKLRLQLTDQSNPLIFISGIVNKARISRVFDNGDWFIISSRGDAKWFGLDKTPMYLKECDDENSVLHEDSSLVSIPARCPTPEEWIECVHVLAPMIVNTKRKMFTNINDMWYNDDMRNWDLTPEELAQIKLDTSDEDRLSPTPLHLSHSVSKLSDLMQDRLDYLSRFDEVVVTEFGFTNVIAEWTVYTHPSHHIFELMASERNPCPCCTREYAMRTDCLQDFQFWHCREAQIYFLLASPEMHDTHDAAMESLAVAERIRQAMASSEYRMSMKSRFSKIPASVQQFRTFSAITGYQIETVQEFTDRMTACISARPVSINVATDDLINGQPSDHVMNWQPWVIGRHNFTRENICSCSSCELKTIFTNDKFGEVHYCPTINMHRRIIDVSSIEGIVPRSELGYALDEAFTRQQQIRAKIFQAKRYHSSTEYAAEEARMSAIYGKLPVEHPEWVCSIKADLPRSARRFADELSSLPELKWTEQFRTSGCNHKVCHQQRSQPHMEIFVHFTNQRNNFIGLSSKKTVNIISVNTFRNVNHPFVDCPSQPLKYKYIAPVKLTTCLTPVLRDDIYMRLALGQDVAYEAASKAESVASVSKAAIAEAVDVLSTNTAISWADMLDTDMDMSKKWVVKNRLNLIHVLASDPSKFLMEHYLREQATRALTEAIKREDKMLPNRIAIPTVICIYSSPLCTQKGWEKFISAIPSALAFMNVSDSTATLDNLKVKPAMDSAATLDLGLENAHGESVDDDGFEVVLSRGSKSKLAPVPSPALLINICQRSVHCDNVDCTDIHWPIKMCNHDSGCWLYKQRRCCFLHTAQQAFQVSVSDSPTGFYLHPSAIETLPKATTRAGLKRL